MNLRYKLFFCLLSVIIISGDSCKKQTSSSKPTKVNVELQVGYLPYVTTSSVSIDFYYTRTVGNLAHERILSRPYFDTTYTLYMSKGDSIKMVDPKDSLYGIFFINGSNVSNSYYNNSGSLVYYYIKS